MGQRMFLFACFVVYVLLGNTLTAEAAFVSMQLFFLFSTNMTWCVPMGVSTTSELWVTCKRIQVWVCFCNNNIFNKIFYFNRNSYFWMKFKLQNHKLIIWYKGSNQVWNCARSRRDGTKRQPNPHWEISRLIWNQETYSQSLDQLAVER